MLIILVAPVGAPYFPCKSSIVLLLDGSNGLSYAPYAQQKLFIADELLTSQWSHFERLAIGQYDDNEDDYQVLSPFNNLHNVIEAKAIVTSAYQFGDTPSLAMVSSHKSYVQGFWRD